MISNIINFNVECIKLLLILCGVLNYKFKKSRTAVAIMIICNFSLVLLGVIDNNYQVSAFIYIAIVIVALLVEGRHRFLFSVFSFLGISCLDGMLLVIVKKLFNISNEIIIEKPLLLSAINSFSVIILVCVVIIMQKVVYKKRGNEQRILSNTDVVYLVISVIGLVATLIFVSPFVYPEYEHSVRNNQIVTFFAGMLSVLFFIVGILLLYNSHSKNNYKYMYEVDKKLLELQKNYYRMLLEKEEETRRFRHDIDNHVLCIQALIKEGEKEAAQEYLEELRGTLDTLKADYQTGNMLVNIVVNDICGKYKPVKLEWDGCLPESLKMSNMDICIIFSNILENAFSAAARCGDCGRVNVWVKVVENSLVIKVQNNMHVSVRENKGRFITNKKDKRNHGIGIENVKKSVYSKGGMVDFRYSDTEFIVEIILPNII